MRFRLRPALSGGLLFSCALAAGQSAQAQTSGVYCPPQPYCPPGSVAPYSPGVGQTYATPTTPSPYSPSTQTPSGIAPGVVAPNFGQSDSATPTVDNFNQGQFASTAPNQTDLSRSLASSFGDNFGGSPISSSLNTIGDFYGGINSLLDVNVSLATTFYDYGSPATFQFSDAAALAAGQHFTASDSAGYGIFVEAQNNVGSFISAGDSEFIDPSDIDPALTSVFVQAGFNADQINAALASGSAVVPATIPVGQGEIMTRLRNAVLANAPEFTGNYDNLGEFVRIGLNANSTLNVVRVTPSSGPGPSSSSSSYLVVTPNYIYDITFALPTPAPGDLVGRTAISDNNNPLPRDRVFFDFNYFHNAKVGPADLPVNRFTPGFEKTYLGGDASVEVRVPMAVTLSSDLVAQQPDVLDYQVGDVLIAPKFLLFADDYRALTSGIGVTVPTANDFNIGLADGTPILSVQSQSVRLQPYLAGLFAPNINNYVQVWGAVNVDANGNTVLFNPTGLQLGSGGSLVRQGRLQSTTIGKLDISYGRWVVRNPQGRLKGLILAQEAHIIDDLGNADRIANQDLRFGVSEQDTIVNLTAGGHFLFDRGNVLSVGYGTPVTDNRGFDGEVRAMWNRYF